MRIKLKEGDLINIVRQLLTEHELPPLADEFKLVQAAPMINTNLLSQGELAELIDIGPYYVVKLWYTEDTLFLFDKDIFATPYDLDRSLDPELEQQIRNHYINGRTKLASRGDLDDKKAFRKKFFDKYVALINNEINDSKCSVFKDDFRNCMLYVFFDNGNKFFASVMIFGGGNKYLRIYNTFLDYFHVTKKDYGFEVIAMDAFKTAFNFDDDYNVNVGIVETFPPELIDINSFEIIDSMPGREAINNKYW